jgi:hypothetical protein
VYVSQFVIYIDTVYFYAHWIVALNSIVGDLHGCISIFIYFYFFIST